MGKSLRIALLILLVSFVSVEMKAQAPTHGDKIMGADKPPKKRKKMNDDQIMSPTRKANRKKQDPNQIMRVTAVKKKQRQSLDVINNSNSSVTVAPRKQKDRKEQMSFEPLWEGSGVNVKLVPGFLWNTVGAEVEFPLGYHMALSVNGYYKIGRTDGENANFKLRQNTALNNGYLAEAQLKYYFTGAPAGIYGFASAGFGNLFYGDGAVRPFSITNDVRSFKGFSFAEDIKAPNPLRVSLGAGYQWIIISRGLVVNVNAGIQNFTTDEGVKFGLYLTPSFGIIF